QRIMGRPRRVVVHYETTGARTIRVRRSDLQRTDEETAFPFEVVALASPAPDDTMHVTATEPYAGVAGTGDAYVLRAPGHAALVDPLVVIEGFDLQNSYNWDELYALLSGQGMVDSLLARGQDLVVLNFTDATDDMRRNARVVETLIRQVEAAIGPSASLAV